MATYDEIKDYVYKTYNALVETCWIVDMENRCGLESTQVLTKKDRKGRNNPCPDKTEIQIKNAFRYFGMIK
ncbi:MAG: hypothetical protein RR348_05815 [Clostridia bacterium]